MNMKILTDKMMINYYTQNCRKMTTNNFINKAFNIRYGGQLATKRSRSVERNDSVSEEHMENDRLSEKYMESDCDVKEHIENDRLSEKYMESDHNLEEHVEDNGLLEIFAESNCNSEEYEENEFNHRSDLVQEDIEPLSESSQINLEQNDNFFLY
ncbi:hypothetical protein SNEBB_005556 [Seison nebaliae]|nr:hypothetical protein SNEBB_005556 [Seison nebaliae]